MEGGERGGGGGRGGRSVCVNMVVVVVVVVVMVMVMVMCVVVSMGVGVIVYVPRMRVAFILPRFRAHRFWLVAIAAVTLTWSRHARLYKQKNFHKDKHVSSLNAEIASEFEQLIISGCPHHGSSLRSPQPPHPQEMDLLRRQT